MATWNSFSYMFSRVLHSFLSFDHGRTASSIIHLLPKATFTPSFQPNLGLPHTRPPLTSAIYTFLAIRYSSILSTYPNHLNTIRTTIFANSLSILCLIRTYSLPTLSILDTKIKLLEHLSQEHSLSFSQHFSYPMFLLRITPLVQLLLHIDTSWPLSQIPYCSPHFSALYPSFILCNTFLSYPPSAATCDPRYLNTYLISW